MSNLGKLLSLEYGEALPADIRSGSGFPVFGSNGIVGFHDGYLIPGPGIVVGRKGSVGKIAWSDENFWPIDTTYWVRPNIVETRWLYWMLSWLPLHQLDTSTGIPGLNRNDVYHQVVYLPEAKERKKIAQILDALDTTIRETEAIIAKLKAVKQGLLHDLLTRGLDDNGELRSPQSEAPHLYKKSKLGWIPKEWGSRKIEDCLIQIVDGDRGKNYPSESEFTSGGYCLFLNAKNVTRDGFKFEETLFITESKDRTLGSGKLERNDIVITTRGTIGNFGFFDDSITFEHMRVNSGMLILRNQDASINSVFLFLSLKNYIFPFELQTKGSGSAQPQLPSKDLKTFHVLLPPIVEQIVLAEKIIKFEQRVASEEKALSKAIKLKSGLMDDLLTGRVRVTPLLNNLPNTSPEAAL